VEPKTPEQRVLLSKSQCGLDNRVEGLVNRILVCCPQSKRGDIEDPQPTAPKGNEQQPGNVLPGSDDCGFLFDDRIFGGTATSLWEFPWMVLLQYKKREYLLYRGTLSASMYSLLSRLFTGVNSYH